MNGGRTTWKIRRVLRAEADEAFRFHEAIAGSDEHIWPRTRDQVNNYAGKGYLFWARRSDTLAIGGLCYAVPDAEISEDGEDAEGPKISQWEVGGLTVESGLQKQGIGTALAVYALAHTLVFQEPWKYGQTVIAHVHSENSDPRRLVAMFKMKNVGRIEVPGDIAPKSMARNAAGKVEGDEYELTADGVEVAIEWIITHQGNTGHGADFQFDFGRAQVLDVVASLREIAGRAL